MVTQALFFLLLLLLPTQLGKHFFLDFSYINGVRVDYNAIAFYLTDVLAGLIIITNIKPLREFITKHIRSFFFIIALIFINIIASTYPALALYAWLKIAEILALFIIFSRIKTDIKLALSAFLIGAVFEFILAALQLREGQALQGIFYFLGERAFSLSTPGIAKTVFMGKEILRPYATFSHPNSMGGFYLLVYTLGLFSSFSIVPTKEEICSVLYKFPIKLGVMTLASVLIMLSFSKVAIAGYILVTGWYIFTKKWNNCKPCFIATLTITGVIPLIFLQALGDPFSLEKRLSLFTQAIKIIRNHFLSGVGLGHYLFYQEAFPTNYSDFFLQPVHNIFLLFVAQTGIVLGGIIFYYLVVWIWQNRKISVLLMSIFVIVFTGLFDHYWLTLQQNMLLLGIALGFTSYARSQ